MNYSCFARLFPVSAPLFRSVTPNYTFPRENIKNLMSLEMSLQKWGIGSRRGDRKDRKFQRKFPHEFSPLIWSFETLPNFCSGVSVTNFPNVPDWAARSCCLTSGKKEFKSSRAFSAFFAVWFVSVIPCYTFHRKAQIIKLNISKPKRARIPFQKF